MIFSMPKLQNASPIMFSPYIKQILKTLDNEEYLSRIVISHKGCVWGLNPSGELFSKTGIAVGNPFGNSWKKIRSYENDPAFMDISASSRDLWIVSYSGHLYTHTNICT